MASRIKGITIEIGGDTTGLESALKDVNKRTKEVQSELKDVQRLLKFDPNNVELLAQRQQLLTEAIQSSTDKLNQLRSAQSQVEQQFQSGEIGEEQYRAFRRELQATEQQLSGFQQALQDMQTEQEQVGQRTRQMSALFEATGTSVEDYANVIGQRLVRAIQNGTATSRDLEYAFQRIGRQAIGANGDIERLRTALASVDDGNSVQNIRRDLQQLQSEAEQTAESVEGIGESLQGVAGALVAGGGIAGAVEQALDMSSLDTKIDITFDVSEESKQSVKEAVRGIQAYGFEGEEALEGVRRQWALNKDASDATNSTIVKGAAAIAKNFAGIDFIELVQETNEIGSALKVSNTEALALVDSLLKTGFPPEQLDTIAEYGLQMKQIGFSTSEIQAIFEKGVDLKSWNIDNLNDGVKEANLQMRSFGEEVPKSLSDLLSKTNMSTKQMQTWGKSVAAGGKEGAQAMGEVSEWLKTIEDDSLRNALAVAVFGTKAEDQADAMIAIFDGVAEAVDKTNENMNGLYSTMGKTNADPMVQLQQALTNVKIAAEPVLQVVADIISKIANWIAENPKLAATIAIIATGIGILLGVVMALAPIITAIAASATALSIGMVPLIGIIAGVAAGIAALIAIGVLLYQNWDTVKSFALSIWSVISEHFGGVFEQIKGYVQTGMQFVKSIIQSVLTAAVSFAKDILSSFAAFWKENGAQIVAIVKGAMSLVSSIISGALKIIEGLFQAIWPIVSGLVKVAWGIISTTIKSNIDFILGVIQFFLKIFKGDWSGAFETIKETTQKIWNNIVKTFKDLDLLQIGKDIINGLIKGITSMATGVIDAVVEIASSVGKVIKSVLGIHSPSRVTTELGKHTGQGFADGISKKQKEVEKAAKKNATAAAKNFKEALESANYRFKIGEVNAIDHIQSLEKVRNNYAKTPEQVRKVNLAILDVEKKHAKQIEDQKKKEYDSTKSWLDKKKQMNQLSLTDELAAWERIQARYKAGSKEREEAEMNVYRIKKEINDKINTINDDYLNKVKTLNQQLIDEENKLNAEYQKALDDRAKALYSFAGIFDEVIQKEVSGDTLLQNLQSQVTAFQDWQSSITELAAKGINEGLLAELREMGPKAGAEIAALNTLTDEQLAQYVLLWQEKNRLAKEQAVKELEGLKIETNTKIEELRISTANKLLAYQEEWRLAMVGVKGKVNAEMQAMPGIGQYAVSGLIDGMMSKQSELMSAAQALASVVASTFQGALDIHSPSRVFKGFGVNITEGLIEGIQQSQMQLKRVVENAYGSLANSAQQLIVGNQERGSSTRTIDQSKKMYNTIHISTASSDAQAVDRALRRLAFQF